MPCEQKFKKSKPLYFGREGVSSFTSSIKAKSGAVLVLTLLIIVVLAVVAVAFMQNTTSERFMARSHSNFYRGQLAAEAGLAAATGALIRGTTNDHFVVVLNQTNRQLYIGMGQPAGTGYEYIPLFSATTGVTNAPFGLANTEVPSTDVTAGTNFAVQLPGGVAIESPDVSWVYLTDSSGQTNARFAYWVEDLAGKLDLSVVGTTGPEARRPTGTNPSEIALWSLFTNAASDLSSTPVTSLVTARSNLFTAASARIVTTNATAAVLADLAAGLMHDTNEPQVIPYGFGYAQQGQPKVNLNSNLTAAGASNIINRIEENLPLFASTNRSGGMSPATYLNYLAANIVDYADADFAPTVVGGEAGNEPMPWLTEIWDLTVWRDEPGSPAVVTNATSDETNYIANISIITFAEFWNMTDQEVTCDAGDLVFSQSQTNRQIRRIYTIGGTNGATNSDITARLATNSWSYTNATNIHFRANEYIVLMVASNRISLNFGTNTIPPVGDPDKVSLRNEGWTNGGRVTYTQYFKNIKVDEITNAAHGLARIGDRATRREAGGWQWLWLGNAMAQPVDLTNGLYGDPRISRHLNSGRIQANFYGGNTWGGRNYNAHSSSGIHQNEIKHWPDGGYITNSPRGVTMQDVTVFPTNHLSMYYSNAPVRFNNSGAYAKVTELGNIFDPLQWIVNGADGPAFITSTTATTNANGRKGGGGQSLRIGRAEHPRFAITTNTPPAFTNGLRASQLLDIFEVGPATAAVVSNVSAGRININTASTNVLRALAAGVFHSSDPVLTPGGTNFVVPTTAVDAFVTGVTNYRSRQPFFAPSQLTLIATNTNLSEWPTNAVFGNSAIAGVTEWSDAASEEWFSKIYPLSTVRSRNFLIYVVGQAVAPTAPTRVESEARQVFQVYMEPERGGANGLTTNSLPVVIRSWSL
jgi:hypothetical protein